jgi:hypothetical protein
VKQAEEIAELVKVYKKLEDQYQHLYYQSRYLYQRVRYDARRSPWKLLDIRNRSRVTGLWKDAVNARKDSRKAWEEATSQDEDSLIIWNMLPGHKKQKKAQIDVGQIELQDGTAIGALDTIGDVRETGIMSDKALGLIKETAYSEDPLLNTAAAQQNIANAISLVEVEEFRAANQIAVAQTEILLLGLKDQREGAMRAAMAEASFRKYGLPAMRDVTSGGSEAIRKWRLP